MISGTIGGGLCLWKGRNCCKAIADAHDGAVEVLSVANTRGGMIASGGRDAKARTVYVYFMSILLSDFGRSFAGSTFIATLIC